MCLGKTLSNYFTVSSTRRTIEFVHGEKAVSSQSLKWLTPNDFEFSLLLGSGGFGAVFKAKRKSTNIDYALKVQPIGTMARSARSFGKKTEDETLIHMERTVLASCRGHPFIVSMEYAFYTDMYAVLALEYVPGGTLSNLIAKSPEKRLPFSLCKIYVIEIILALNFMHCKGIIYRDLKPSNILIALTGHLKLTDFGLAGSMVRKRKSTKRSTVASAQIQSSSRRLDSNLIFQMTQSRPDEPTASTDHLSESSERAPEIASFELGDNEKNGKSDVKWVRRRTVCGTAGYRPPEQVQERFLNYFSRHGYDERADWFSLGVCCYTMLTGHRPFPTKKELLLSESQRRLICKRKLPSRAVGNEVFDKLLNDPEYQCLMFEVEFPSYFNCELHAKGFINALLERDPESRPRYDEIRQLPWMRGESFETRSVMSQPIPDWVRNHTLMQAIQKDIPMHLSGGNNATTRTLGDCINDMCSEYVAKNNPDYAENFASKWKSKPSQRAINLFRHWNYISDDAIIHEIRSLVEKTGECSISNKNTQILSLRSITSQSRQDSLKTIV